MKRLFLNLLMAFLLISQCFTYKFKSFDQFSRKSKSKKTSKRLSISIGGIVKLVKKYLEFSKTNWGAFLNGFFMGILQKITQEKSETNCEKNEFCEIVSCFVGGTDKGLDEYYATLNLGNFKDLPNTAEQSITETSEEAKKLGADPDDLKVTSSAAPQTDNSWSSYLRATWDSVKQTFKAIWEKVLGKLSAFYDKIKGFFESPLLKGVIHVAKCVTAVKAADIFNASLNALLTFLGVPWITNVIKILKDSPAIFEKIKALFVKLSDALTKTYTTPQLKYYTYGTVAGELMQIISQLFSAAKRMKRFKYLFRRKNKTVKKSK